jgi:Glucose/sorbosone dehydrogenases
MNRIFGIPSEKENANEKQKVKVRQEPGEFPFSIEIVAENLKVPWAIDISDEGILYVTERTGTVRTIDDGRLNPDPLIRFSPPFSSIVEDGLMGIALDPDFSQNHYLYVMYSYLEGNKTYNRVVRLIEQNRTAAADRILVDRIPGGLIHNGGRIKFGPDKKLYITTGDAGIQNLAQDPASLGGKILRINTDGSIPEDNPFPGSPVYALGLRNPQGLAWNLNNNALYASDHGSIGYDEINLIIPGGNYGWPLVQGDEERADMDLQKPLIQSGGQTWAPSGIAYMNLGPWKGKLLAAALVGEELLAFPMNKDRTEVKGAETWLKGTYGRLREVIQSKDGSIYITTSNRDGRGIPNAGDDKILRLVPKG